MGRNDTYIYGINPVTEALLSGRKVKSIYCLKGFHGRRRQELLTLIESKGLSTRVVDRAFFQRFGNAVHQGICAQVERRRFLTVDDLWENTLGQQQIPLFVILDGVEDPRNLGAVIRVAEGAGASGAILQSRGTEIVTSAVVKASSGATEYLPLCIVSNIKHAMRFFRDKGVTIIGTDPESPQSIWDADLTPPVAIIVGSEGKGLRRTVKASCDTILRLPLYGRVNSLNVSVATGVFLFECKRQRVKKSWCETSRKTGR